MARGGIGETADIAFFKFCYVDVTASTEVDRLFTFYQQLMSDLNWRFPDVIFIHFTVPLTIVQTGLKKWIKNISGRKPREYADNLQREMFNQKIREEYLSKEPVFDLAKLESTGIDGTRKRIEQADNDIFYLVPALSDDGSHLNETGRKLIAARLFHFLIIESK